MTKSTEVEDEEILVEVDVEQPTDKEGTPHVVWEQLELKLD